MKFDALLVGIIPALGIIGAITIITVCLFVGIVSGLVLIVVVIFVACTIVFRIWLAIDPCCVIIVV